MDSLEQELWAVVRHHFSNQTRVLGKEQVHVTDELSLQTPFLLPSHSLGKLVL